MTRPAWAPTCTCGETPLGYFCYPCHAWAGSSHGEQASWSRPRLTSSEESENVGTEGLSQGDTLPGSPADVSEEPLLPPSVPPPLPGKPCANGRHARPARRGERLLPCGCPLGGAPRECIDAVATKTVTVKRTGIDH